MPYPRRLLRPSFALAAALILAGCGGGSSHSSGSTTSVYAGSYQTTLSATRSDELVLLVAVDASGNAQLTVSNSTGIAYSGRAKVDSAGTLSIVAAATTPGDASTTFSLQFSASGTAAMSGSASGALNLAGISATAQSTSPYAGTYALGYDGDASGTGTLTVGTDGKILGSVDYDGTSLPVTGTIKGVGDFSIVGNGNVGGTGYKVGWSGAFFPTAAGASGSGGWTSSSGYSGTWTTTRN